MQSDELILQAHQGENAPAALAMILAHHGLGVSMGELSARRLESAADLITAARRYGLYSQGYTMSCQELYQAPLPLIAYWRFREFIVVTAVRGGRIFIDSPAEGRFAVSKEEFEAGFTGVAICFASDAEKEQPSREQERPALLLRAFPSAAALLAVAELFVCACCLILLTLLRIFAGHLASPREGMGWYVCVMGVFLLLQAGACGLQLWLLRRCGTRMSADAVRNFTDRLDSESAAFFLQNSRYRLGLAGAGCGKIPLSLAYEVFYGLQLVTGAFCAVLMMSQDICSAVVAVAGAAAYAAACVLWRDELYNDEKLTARDRDARYEQLAQDANRWETLRLSGENRERFGDWLQNAGAATRLSGRPRQARIWHRFAATELLIVFCVCLLRTLSGTVGIPALLGCVYLAGILTASMAALPCLLAEQTAVRSTMEELGNVFQGEPPPVGRHGGLRAGTLGLQNGSVRYGGAKDVIKNITFQVRSGELLVVDCREENGRKALSRVLSGLEPPAQGVLYLGNIRADEASETEIYKNITLLGNGLPFPSGTVRENIAAGFRGLTDYAVVEAASDAMLHRSILLREKGYDTPAASLSDGERVLLEFACAFARGTPFLVASDIVDTLDRETAHSLIQALRRRGIGTVLLTGETPLVQEADLVCRIEEGRMTMREQTEFLEWEAHSGV